MTRRNRLLFLTAALAIAVTVGRPSKAQDPPPGDWACVLDWITDHYDENNNFVYRTYWCDFYEDFCDENIDGSGQYDSDCTTLPTEVFPCNDMDCVNLGIDPPACPSAEGAAEEVDAGEAPASDPQASAGAVDIGLVSAQATIPPQLKKLKQKLAADRDPAINPKLRIRLRRLARIEKPDGSRLAAKIYLLERDDEESPLLIFEGYEIDKDPDANNFNPHYDVKKRYVRERSPGVYDVRIGGVACTVRTAEP